MDRCVMIIDDDVDIRETIQDLLEARGFTVVAASDGAGAMAELRKGARPCVILLDLMMPGLSGEAFRALQLADAALADIPVVALSGAHTVDAAARRMGVESLAKPIELAELMSTIVRFCPRGKTPR